MRFEARELRDYAEPVSVTDLHIGRIYFLVNFVDEEMLIPVMEPIVFIGRDLDPGDEAQFYFQDAESYRRGIRHPSSGDQKLLEDADEADDERAMFHICSDGQVNHVFDYEKGLDVLLMCSLRRRRGEGAGGLVK